MQQKSDTDSYDPVQLMARGISYLPKILYKSGTAWLSFKLTAKKGGRIFQKELIRNGLDKDTAMHFTEDYISTSNLLRIFFDRP